MTDLLAAQVAVERDALRLVRRADVRAAVTTQAERWRAGTPGFRPQTYAQLRSSIDEVVLLVALQVANSDPHRSRVVEISAGPHDWGGLNVPGGRWGINNPDTLYFAAPVEHGSRYVLTGRPRGTPPTDLNVSVQLPDVWGVLDTIGHDDLDFAADGSFEIALGDDTAGSANRLPVRASGTVLMIRQTLADWTRELPYHLSIERVGGDLTTSSASEDDVAAQLIDRLGLVIDHSLRTLQPPIFRLPANSIPQPGIAGDKSGYLTAQRNALGHYRLDDDEALVLVLSPGGAGYAAVGATNVWGVTSDSARHQNSLNIRQAVPDKDGRITMVVAHVDPGVANWIEPGGPREGILMLRWQRLAHGGDRTTQPSVTVRRVGLAELAALPSSVQRVDTVAQRQALRDERAAAYARRFELR